MARRAEPEHVGERRAASVLLLVDFLQPYPGDEGALLHRETRAVLPAVLALRRAARRADVPVVYVNDHFGHWRSRCDQTIARAASGPRGDIARRLRPSSRDYFVLKPGRSGFYQSPLESLLAAFGARGVVIAGVATDLCVLATAGDAVMRKLRVTVPPGCSASITPARHRRALALLGDMGCAVRLPPWVD
jgi:nicotinamidase-related amidase